jgi:hypothetical protein
MTDMRTVTMRMAIAAAGGLGLLAACTPAPVPNPYLTLTENVLGVTVGNNSNTNSGTGGGGVDAGVRFRANQTITLINAEDPFPGFTPGPDLNVSMVAWINVSSLRSAEQQDLLLSNNYVQLPREVRIGIITLPPGTFVYNGSGVAGATHFKIPPGGTESLSIVTPDRILLFSAPPVSCEDPAFYFTTNDEIVRSPQNGIREGAVRSHGVKTLAQIDAYQCDPLNPGLFLRTGGGSLAPNEYREGDAISVSFLLNVPLVAGDFPPAANVTIGGAN